MLVQVRLLKPLIGMAQIGFFAVWSPQVIRLCIKDDFDLLLSLVALLNATSR